MNRPVVELLCIGIYYFGTSVQVMEKTPFESQKTVFCGRGIFVGTNTWILNIRYIQYIVIFDSLFLEKSVLKIVWVKLIFYLWKYFGLRIRFRMKARILILFGAVALSQEDAGERTGQKNWILLVILCIIHLHDELSLFYDVFNT